MRASLFLLPLIVCMAPVTARAGALADGYVTQLQDSAAAKALWEHREWLDLGHYRPSGLSDNGYTSSVDDAHFFHSADGKTSRFFKFVHRDAD